MQVLWKKFLVCLSAVGVKTLINVLLKIWFFLVICFMHLFRSPFSLSGYNIADFVIYNVDLSGLAIQESSGMLYLVLFSEFFLPLTCSVMKGSQPLTCTAHEN